MALNTTGLLLVVGVVGGAVGAGAAALVAPSPPPPVAPAPDPRVGTLEDRLVKAEQELAGLRGELAEVRAAAASRSAAAPKGAPEGPGAKGPDGTTGIPPAPDASVLVSAPIDASERARIEAVIKDMQAKQQEERAKRQKEQQTQVIKTMLDRRAAEARLSDPQKEQVLKVLGDYYDRRREIRNQASVAGGPEAARRAQEDVQRARDEARTTLSLALTADQMKVVEAMIDRAPDPGTAAGLPGAGRDNRPMTRRTNRANAGGGTEPAPATGAGGAVEPPK